jgi:hypothetical protein
MIHNRSGVGIVVETGQAANTGNWSDSNKTTKQSLQNREATTRNPPDSTFRVTAAPVGAPSLGINWHGTVTENIDLYVVSTQDHLQISLQDPG